MGRLTASVLIPAYNAEATIAQAVASAFDQTVAPLEVLVADDGSTDATRAVAERAGAKVIALDHVNGSAARNHAARIARGDVFFFLDADDYWNPGKIEAHLDVWEREQPGLVLDVALYVHPDGRPHYLHGKGPEGPLSWRRLLDRKNWTSGSSMSVSRRGFALAGGFNEALVALQDVDFWIRCAHANGDAYRIAESHTNYRLTPNSVSRRPKPVEENLERMFVGWPFADEAARREVRRTVLLNVTRRTPLPGSLRYFAKAGWPVALPFFWRCWIATCLRTLEAARRGGPGPAAGHAGPSIL
jgi:glycosyltransferase involved in cell wall biosynthesis